MSQKLETWIRKIKRKHGKTKLWKQVLSILMAVTVFTTTYALIMPAITMEKTYCGIDEHTHSAENGCYTEHKTLICTQEEGGHTHTDECYAEQNPSVCVIEESAGHTHTEGCYAEQSSLTCTLEETEGHTHSDGCYDADGSLLCEHIEGEGHIHSDECYITEKVPVCGLEESEGHTHGEACSAAEMTLICGQEEYENDHVHTDICYETTLELTCDKEEHSHSKACYCDPEADVETAAVWESSFDNVELTGVWARDVLAIADSQLGYAESTENYAVGEDDTTKGYTRYGAWYGDAYGDWSAMFVSFCLNYAGVDRGQMPVEADCAQWVQQLSETGLYHAAENAEAMLQAGYTALERYTSKPGDLIFFDTNEDGKADHTGLVYELIRNETGEAAQVKTIEGDSVDTVRYNTYELSDVTILGYAELPENPNPHGEEETTVAAPDVVPEEEASAVEPVTASEGETSAEAGERAEEITLSVETENFVTITMTAAADAFDVPAEELRLRAAVIEDEAAKELLEQEAAANDTENVKRNTMLFDIEVLHGDEVVQPKKPVQIHFSGIETPKDDAQVFHVDTEAEAVEEMAAEQEENGDITMEAPHFSIYGVTYTVDFHFGEYDFSILGLDSITLSELFSALQIERNAADAVRVEFSDPALVAVEQIADDRKLTSLQAFTTEETLRIEFVNGDEIVITVTDAPASGIGENYVANTGTLAVNVTKTTGTAPWDADNNPGNDASADNDVVRSFDTVFYNIGYTMNLTDKYTAVFKGYKKANLYFEVNLPFGKEQAEFALDAMPQLSNANVTDNGTGQTLTGYYAMDAGIMDYVLPSTGTVKLAVYVKDMANGSIVRPEINAWLDSDQKQAANPSAATVSSKTNYNVRLERIAGTLVKSGNFTTGQLTKFNYINNGGGGTDATAHLVGYNIILESKLLNPEKGLKGISMSANDISFEIYGNYKCVYTGGGKTIITTSYPEAGANYASKYKPKLWDYRLIDNTDALTGVLGRDLYGFYDRAKTSSPYSARTSGTTEDSVLDSGTMTVTEKNDSDKSLIVTFQGIDTDYLFPKQAAKADALGKAKSISADTNYLAVGTIVMYCPKYTDTAAGNIGGSLFTEKIFATVRQSSLPEDSSDNMDTYNVEHRISTGGSSGWFVLRNTEGITLPENTARMARGDEFYAGIRSHIMFYQPTANNNCYGMDLVFKFDAAKFELDVGAPDFIYSKRYLEDQSPGGDDLPSGWNRNIYYLTTWAPGNDVTKWNFKNTVYKSLADLEAAGKTCIAVWIELRAEASAAPLSQMHDGSMFTYVRLKVKDDAPYTVFPAIGTQTYETDFSFFARPYKARVQGSSISMYSSWADLPDAFSMHGMIQRGNNTDLNIITGGGLCTFGGGSWEYRANGSFLKKNPGYYVGTNAVVNPEGATALQMGGFVAVVNEETKIEKAIAQQINGGERTVFCVENGERAADYVLSPETRDLRSVNAGTDRSTTVTITDTLPKGLTYVPDSTYIGGTYNQPTDSKSHGTVTGGTHLFDNATVSGIQTSENTTGDTGDVTMSVTNNADGTTTLEWVLTNVQVGRNMPKIYYSTDIGDSGDAFLDVRDGDQLTNNVVIRSTESVDSENSHTITVSKLAKATLIKHVETPEVDLDEDITYTIYYTNDSGNTITSIDIRDILPYNGDARGSMFSGSYTVDRVTLERMNDAAGSYAMAYTTDTSVRGHEGDVFAIGITSIPNLVIATSSVNGKTTTFKLPANTSPTMLVFAGGNIGAYAQAKITITLHPTGNKDKGVYLNDTAYNASGIPAPVHTVPVQAKVRQQHFDLTVSKVVNPDVDNTRFEFAIDITKGQGQGLIKFVPASDICKIYKDNQEVADASALAAYELNISQSGTVTVKLGNNEKLVIENIPEGYTAAVTETENAGYTTTYTTDGGAATATGRAASVIMTKDQVVGYTNTRAVTDLKVKKTVVGTGGGTFTFDLTFTNNAADVIASITANTTAQTTGYTIETDKITFDLQGGQQVTIPGIPVGTEMTLSETVHDGYSTAIYDITGGIHNRIADSDMATFTMDAAKDIEVINNPGVALPNTGGAGTGRFVIGGLLIMLAGAAAYIIINRRSAKN